MLLTFSTFNIRSASPPKGGPKLCSKPLPERYSSLTSDDVSVKTIEVEDKKENSHD
jgi:hypothetical protein